MIVRERENAFVMIEQNHHGHISERIMNHWKESRFPHVELRESVLLAIKHHDLGWEPFDQEPFWNDAKLKPYSFIDFPLPSKAVLYVKGIDDVETIDLYAAMLCSYHYCQFMIGSQNEDALHFVAHESERRSKLKEQLTNFDEHVFQQHYGLLQLGDNLSLYACVNEPGVAKGQEHPFFQDGIPSPEALITVGNLQKKTTDIRFVNEQEIRVKNFPFDEPFVVSVPQRVVLKKNIREKGLLEAYQNSDVESVSFHFTAE